MIQLSPGIGYFQSPFTDVVPFGTWQAQTGLAAGDFGAWAHLLAVTPTVSGRWVSLSCSPNDQPTAQVLKIKIGRGAAGAEVLFLPNAGTNAEFTARWGLTDGTKLVPVAFSFPYQMAAGIDISFSIANDIIGVQNVLINMYIWS
ncbi:hypothetical protein M0R72_17395 [Candidatus Pacearchaeota archaeon]|jgi:hypothetical protein|nr:hypothetical protein [Candidatus Pacearchaeota archaeon]